MQSINFNGLFIDWLTKSVKNSPKDKVAKGAELTIPIISPQSAAEPISFSPIPPEIVEVLSPPSEQMIDVSIPGVDIPNAIVAPNPIVDSAFDSLVPRVEMSASVINTASEGPVPMPASAIEIPETTAEKTITVIKPPQLVPLSLSQRILAKLTLSKITYLLIIAGAVALAIYFLYRRKNQKSKFKVPEEIRLDEPAVIELRDDLKVVHLNQNKRNRNSPEFVLQNNQGVSVKDVSNSVHIRSNTKENVVSRINKFFQKSYRMLRQPLLGFHHLHDQVSDTPLEKSPHKIERLIRLDAEPLIEQRERSTQYGNTEDTSLKSTDHAENHQQELKDITASNHIACHIISPRSINSKSENKDGGDDPIHLLNQTGEERITMNQGRDPSAENTTRYPYPQPPQFHLEQNLAPLRDRSISLPPCEDSLGNAQEKSVNLFRYNDAIFLNKRLRRGLISNPNDSRYASTQCSQSPARTKQDKLRRSSITTDDSKSPSLDSTWDDSPSSSRHKYPLQPKQVVLFYENNSGSSSPAYEIVSNR